MIYAIAVDFDRESTTKINQKIIEIAESNINPYMVKNKIPPHLTISLFETNTKVDLDKILKDICINVSRKRIKINYVGKFEPKVIYFAPNKNNYLIKLNEIATNKLIEVGIKPDKYYLPGEWVPHIALGVQLKYDELTRALEIVKKGFEPFNASVEKIVLAKCNPYKEILEYTI